MALLDWIGERMSPGVAAHGVTLRAPRAGDHADWAALRAESRGYLTPWEPTWPEDDLSRNAFRRRLSIYAREQEAGHAWPMFVFARDELVGAITLSNVRRGVAETGTVGYWIGQPFAGRGLGTAAVRAMVDFAFADLGLHRVEAACVPTNHASRRVLEKAGFEHEGRARAYLKINGEWADHLLFGEGARDALKTRARRGFKGAPGGVQTRSRALAWDATTAIEALAGAEAALWEWTPGADRLRVTGATGALGLGPLAPECSGAAFVALTLPQDRSLAESLLKPQPEGAEVALRLRMRDGRLAVWRGVWLEDGLRAAGLVACDVKFSGSDRDPLTGLLDRRAFLARVTETLARPGPVEIVVADMDRLRRLNEALGHERADMVLSALGSRLAAAFPPEAAPSRIGEDEFAVICRASLTGRSPADRLREALEQPLRVAGFDIYPTVSIGAVDAEGGPDAPDAGELLRRVELAVERAKTAGRGGAAAYGRAMESDSLSRLAMEADLRNAFVRGEIEPFFQPIVNLSTGAVAGFEALARWRHPTRGLVPPDEFLGLTDEMGLMNDLGLLMMTRASRQLAEWLRRHPSAGALFCSVNLSVGEIERANLVEDVSRVIADAGLPRGALKLEVTEGDIMRDTARAAEVLSRLKAAGASLALDDFGTGFSSLTWLAKLPFDTLKIDRYFVLTMDKDEGSAKIVKSVVALGRDLSLEVVAEGVENAGLARRLIEAQCHYGQGFGYAPALNAQEAEVYLNESLADGAAPIKARSA